MDFKQGSKVKGQWHGLAFTGLAGFDDGTFIDIIPSNQTLTAINERRRTGLAGLPVFNGVLHFEKADQNFSIEAA